MGEAQAVRALLNGGVAAIDGLVAALLSPPCIACGAITDRLSTGAVCDACWANIRFYTPPLCARCGDPVTQLATPSAVPHAHGQCGCSDIGTDISRARALGPYEGTLRRMLHALKYDCRRSIARRLSSLLVERCSSVLQGADAVVPVPLHYRRRWSRGFNQAEEIARALRLPMWRVVRRVRATRRQPGLDAAARERNVCQAFRPRTFGAPSRVAGRSIVVVDDVTTTGATLRACAEVLRELGAAEIRVLTVAKTMRSAAT